MGVRGGAPGAGAMTALRERSLLGLEPAGHAHRGDDHRDRCELVGREVAADQAHVRCVGSHRSGGRGAGGGGHSGMFPCFLAGRVSRLVRRARRARATWMRVSEGSMTASTQPRSAAAYGVANFSSNSDCSRARSASTSPPASSTCLRLWRWRMFTASWAPITAIWALGQARLMSAPRSLEPMTMYAPP